VTGTDRIRNYAASYHGRRRVRRVPAPFEGPSSANGTQTTSECHVCFHPFGHGTRHDGWHSVAASEAGSRLINTKNSAGSASTASASHRTVQGRAARQDRLEGLRQTPSVEMVYNLGETKSAWAVLNAPQLRPPLFCTVSRRIRSLSLSGTLVACPRMRWSTPL
jgi:hypothetical protein